MTDNEPTNTPEQETTADGKEKKKKSNIGHMRQRGKNSWQLSYRGNDITIHAKDEQAAERKRMQLVLDIDAGKWKKPIVMTLNDFASIYMRDYGEKKLAPKTRDIYQVVLDTHILPVLGKGTLDKIKPVHILKFYDKLSQDGVRSDGKPGGFSPAYIEKMHNVLSSMFRQAVKWELTDNNPMKNVDRPTVPDKPVTTLDEQQTGYVLECLESQPLKYQALVTLAIFTGLRRGEILGLTNSQVDYERRTISISQTSQATKARGIFQGPTKTKASTRNVKLPAAVMPILKALHAQNTKRRVKAGELWRNNEKSGQHDLFFRQWNGKPMFPNTVDEWWAKYRERIGWVTADNILPGQKKGALPIRHRKITEKNKATGEITERDVTEYYVFPSGVKFHDLRHTSATLMILEGIDVGTIADQLGHVRKSTTLNFYIGTLEESKTIAADKMDEKYGKYVKISEENSGE